MIELISQKVQVNSSCNFETGKCGFEDPNDETWFIADNNSDINPGYDHTCDEFSKVKLCGHWLSTIKPSSSFQGQQTFVLINSDPVAIEEGKPLCLNFWYHFMGIENARFDVQINSGKSAFDARTIWSKFSPQGNNWKQGYVDLSGDSNFDVYIIFKATLNAQYHDTVGLDDLSITSGKCPKTPDCDFETDYCGWKNNGFAYMNGNNTATLDHTIGASLGRYLLLFGDKNKGTLNGSLTAIASIGRSSFYCLKGWYKFIYDNNNPTDAESFLNVQSFNNPLTSLKITIQSIHNDGLVNQWIMFSFQTYAGIFDKSGFSLTAQTFGTTKIAIDDLLLLPNMCGERNDDCDFETDFCGWTNQGSTLWIRNNGRGNWKVLKGVPQYDATTESGKGFYLMLPIEWMSTESRAELRSPPLSSQISCFSLQYWAYAAGSTKLTVLYVYIIDLTKTIEAQVFMINSTSEAKWQKFESSVKQPPGKYSIRITSTLYSNHASLYALAIDNIQLSRTKCWNFNNPTLPPSTPVPPEETAWDCDFDKCKGWWFDRNWEQTSYRRLKDKTHAPRVDHTTRSSSGKYLLWKPATVTSDATNVSTIAPSIVKMSTNLTNTRVHCFSFWYYDTAEIPFELSVFTVTSHSRYLAWRVIRSGIAQNWKQVSIPFAEMSGKFRDHFDLILVSNNSLL